MRIAMSIAITIAITLAAALAPMQQAHGWAQSCADGNTDVCCHLEQIGWDQAAFTAASKVALDISFVQAGITSPCSPYTQSMFDKAIPRMCETNCWGGEIGWSNGVWRNMPTHAEVLTSLCTVNHFVNGTCPPAQQSSSSSTASASVSSTASASVSSTASAPASSTASATESSSSTATNDDAAGASAPLGPGAEDSVGAAAPQTRAHWAFALAFALMLWH
jgi:hypothetical protein